MSQLTHDEKLQIITQSRLADERGDEAEAKRILQQIPTAPWLAKAMKEVFGAEYLEGYDLSEAEAEFGKDWLTRDSD